MYMKKKIIYSLGVTFIVLCSIAGAYYFAGKNKNITIDRGLTADEVAIYEKKIAQTEESLKNVHAKQGTVSLDASNLYLNLGQLYFGLGKISQAESAYKQAIAYDKSNQNAYVSFALLQSEIHDFEGAQNSLSEALKIAPMNNDIWIRYIGVMRSLGKSPEEIRRVYVEALEKTYRHINIITNDAAYEEEQGNTAAALALWKEALQAFPSNDAYKQEIARLSQ